MTKTNDLFLPRRPVTRDSDEYRHEHEIVSERREQFHRDAPLDPERLVWVIESEVRARLGRRLVVLAEGGDGPGGCWACICPTHEQQSGETTWFCPAGNGRICDICCEHDMDDGTDGLRAWGDGPCLGCEHFDEHRYRDRPREVVLCATCERPIAAGSWAQRSSSPARLRGENAPADGGILSDMPRTADDPRWDWRHLCCEPLFTR